MASPQEALQALAFVRSQAAAGRVLYTEKAKTDLDAFDAELDADDIKDSLCAARDDQIDRFEDDEALPEQEGAHLENDRDRKGMLLQGVSARRVGRHGVCALLQAVERMTMDNLICPSCNSADLSEVSVPRTASAPDGTSLPYSDALTVCNHCGERFYTHEQLLASSRARAGALRQHEGLLAPGDIRSIREAYGLSQTELERMLRTGPKTVVRWEKGTVCQSGAADTLLTVIRDEPAIAARLAQRAGVELAPPVPANACWPLMTAPIPTFGNLDYIVNTVGVYQSVCGMQGPAHEASDWFFFPIPATALTQAPRGEEEHRMKGGPATVWLLRPLELVA